MKNKEKPSTARRLLDRFLTETGKKPQESKRFRSDFGKVCRLLGVENLEDLPVESLPTTREAVETRALGGGAPAPTLSRYIKIVEWAIEAGLINPAPDAAVKLGFPEFLRREMTRDWRWAEAVWETVTRYAVGRRVRFEKAGTDFWSAAFDRHIGSRSAGRAEVTCFMRIWNQEAEAGRVPTISFPALPSRKPHTYRAKESEIPEIYRSGIEAFHKWLSESTVKGRGRKRKKREVSIRQQMANLSRYFGYFIHAKGEDISDLGWRALCSRERVMEFIRYTDPDVANRPHGHRYTSGFHQESHINTLIDLLSGPLGLLDCGQKLVHLRKQFLFERKREPLPEHLSPDDIYRVANQLLDRAEVEETQGRLISAAILRRDALFIILTMLFPRRVDIWSQLRIGRHVLVDEGSPIRLVLLREESKPGLRDEVLEVPREVEGLFRRYLQVDRPRLIGDRSDDGMLFIAEGGEGVKKGTLRIAFRNRIRDGLGFEIGTHALRKLWAPRYLDRSDGDYLTVMLILDTSLANIINAYRDGQSRTAAKEYVAIADHLSNEILNGGRPHGPSESAN